MYINNSSNNVLYKVTYNSVNRITNESMPQNTTLFNKKKLKELSSVNIEHNSDFSNQNFQLKENIKLEEVDENDYNKMKYLESFYSEEEIQWSKIEKELYGSMSINNLKIDNELYNFSTDVEFIDTFIVKKAEIEKKFEQALSGEEQKEALNVINKISDSVKNKLVDIFAKSISSFFNESSIIASLEDKNLSGEDKIVDVIKLKENIFKIIDEREIIFGKTINKYNMNISDAEEHFVSNMSSLNTPSTLIEDMNYKELIEMSKHITEINKNLISYSNGFTYNSTEGLLGIELGVAKAKASLIMEYSNLDSKLLQTFNEAVDKNINYALEKAIETRDEFYSDIYKGMEIQLSPINTAKIKNIINSIGNNISNENRFNFRQIVLGVVHDVKNQYNNQSTNYVDVKGYINKNRQYNSKIEQEISTYSKFTREEYFNTELNSISKDWNGFLDIININEKNYYYIPDENKNIINVSV